AFRAGQLSALDFYAALENMCRARGVALSAFPAMRRYLRYVEDAEGIDSEKMFVELRLLERQAILRLARTARQQQLMAESRALFLTRRLADHTLTNEEWEEYKGLSADNARIDASFGQFYREAEIRDEKMAANMLRDMSAAVTGVLVTGGLHSTGIYRPLVGA